MSGDHVHELIEIVRDLIDEVEPAAEVGTRQYLDQIVLRLDALREKIRDDDREAREGLDR